MPSSHHVIPRKNAIISSGGSACTSSPPTVPSFRLLSASPLPPLPRSASLLPEIDGDEAERSLRVPAATTRRSFGCLVGERGSGSLEDTSVSGSPAVKPPSSQTTSLSVPSLPSSSSASPVPPPPGRVPPPPAWRPFSDRGCVFPAAAAAAAPVPAFQASEHVPGRVGSSRRRQCSKSLPEGAGLPACPATSRLKRLLPCAESPTTGWPSPFRCRRIW